MTTTKPDSFVSARSGCPWRLPSSLDVSLSDTKKKAEQGNALCQDSRRGGSYNTEKNQFSFKAFLLELPMAVLTQDSRSLT